MRAVHWLKSDMTASSGSEPAWTVGETRTYDGPIVLCESGYHWSPNWLAGLEYAEGPTACIVEVSDPIDQGPGKGVSATRTLLAARDVTRELRLFACDCAERALTRERDAGREPNARSWAAIEVVRRYADGQATVAELAGAWAGAWASAGAAAWAGAWAAERDWQRQHLADMLDPLFVDVVPITDAKEAQP
jgi:hypothetical protein